MQGFFKVAQYNGFILIYQADPVQLLTDLNYTNFIMHRIYAETLDRLCVRLNMYLVFTYTFNFSLLL